MDIEKCKQCQWYHLDTLTDGNKEHYCCPPIMLGLMALAIPCEDRGYSECKMILKHIKKHGYILDLRSEEMSEWQVKLELMDKLEKIAKEIAKGNDIYITKSGSGVVIKKMTVGKV